MEYKKIKLRDDLILTREEIFKAKERLRERKRKLPFEEKIEMWLKWKSILKSFE